MTDSYKSCIADLHNWNSSTMQITSLGIEVADLRTSANRESAVERFFKGVTKVEGDIRVGCVTVDSLQQKSRDVNIILLNSNATPSWVLEHGIVHVDGVLFAVFVETKLSSSSALYEQVASVKALLKWLKEVEGYAVLARRTYRAEAGIWAWQGPHEAKTIFATLLSNALSRFVIKP